MKQGQVPAALLVCHRLRLMYLHPARLQLTEGRKCSRGGPEQAVVRSLLSQNKM